MEGVGFIFQFFLLQYLKKIKVYNNCIWLRDLMFYNTYILLCDFFMFKVLRLNVFFHFKIKTYLFYSFWFKSKTWNQPGLLTTSTPLSKQLLTKHLKEVHGLVSKKAKLGRPSTFKEVLDVKTMLKWTFMSWEMPLSCRSEMIKRLLIAFVPKPNATRIKW
jgi:hypothetical protein